MATEGFEGFYVEALIRDPDGRNISLHAPTPDGVVAPDADTHHHEKYGTA